MEEKTIIVKYRRDLENFRRRQADAMKESMIGLAVVALVFLLPALAEFASRDPKLQDNAWQMLFYGLLFLAVWPVGAWLARRGFLKSLNYNTPVAWTITPRRIACELGEGEQEMRGDFAWTMVTKIKRGKYGFHITIARWQAQWLPYSGFEGDGAVEEFRQTALAAGKKIKG